MTLLQKMFAPREFTGWHMLAVLIAFFGTIIAVNLTMAYYANSTWSGLVVKNSYVASQQFNERTAELRAQDAMGWKAEQTYADGEFGIMLSDKTAQPLAGGIVTAKIGRTSHDNETSTVQLTETAAGRYAAPVALVSGLWQADLTVIGARGETWTHSIRFTVK